MQDKSKNAAQSKARNQTGAELQEDEAGDFADGDIEMEEEPNEEIEDGEEDGDEDEEEDSEGDGEDDDEDEDDDDEEEDESTAGAGAKKRSGQGRLSRKKKATSRKLWQLSVSKGRNIGTLSSSCFRR